MADSTASIDSTAFFDATAYIYVDDSTSTISASESAQAAATVRDFDAKVGPMEKQAKDVENEFSDIIDDLSRIDPEDYTPEAMMDAYTSNALNQAYRTVAWQQGVDGLKQANVISSRCSLFNQASLPKYGDLARQVESMRKGVIDDVQKGIEDVATDIIAKSGRDIPENEIGQKMSRTVNTGSTKSDVVKTENTSAVSSILETGKSAMGKAQSTMSKLAAPMRLLDSMIECTNAVGGSEYTGAVDGMIDKTNNLYSKMYMYDDPAQPNYGEFNQTAFSDSIPSVPKKVVDNMFKVANMTNKSENNANLSTDRLIKQAKEGSKSTSSLAPNGQTQSTDQKRSLAEQLSEVQVSFPKVPPAPGREAQQSETVTADEPEKAETPIQTDPQPQPAEEISYRNLIFDREFIEDGSYSALDPNLVGVPAILNTATDIIPDGGTTDTDAKMKIIVTVNGVTLNRKSAGGGQEYYRLRIEQVLVEFERVDIPPGGDNPIGQVTGAAASGKEQDADKLKERSADQKQRAVTNVVGAALNALEGNPRITQDDFESTFG